VPRIGKACRALTILFLLASLLYRDLPSAGAASTVTPRFDDLQDHWAKSQITRLATLGMVKGYRDNTYKPDQMVSRLEALVLIVQSAGYSPAPASKTRSSTKNRLQKPSANTSARVPWGQPYLDMAEEKGFLPKPADGEFDLNAPATRIDIAELLARVLYIAPPLNAKTFALDDNTSSTNNSQPAIPKDIDTVPETDQPLLQAVVNAGIMSGYPDGTFHPHQTVSRAELAAIVSQLIDLGWIKTKDGQRQPGWISQVTIDKKNPELELTSLSGAKKYKLAKSAQCYKNGLDWPIKQAYGYRCEIILDGSKQVSWINLLEQKETTAKPEKIRGSVKSLILGNDNLLVVNDLSSRDHMLPIAWDAVFSGKKGTQDFKSLKVGAFVDLQVDQGQAKKVTLLEVKTLSDTVQKTEGRRLYLKSGLSKTKPGWFNYWDHARIIDNEGSPKSNVLKDDKVQITYLDPYPGEIDDEIVLEIKITTKQK